ncbi:MAG: carbon storage regulator [Planctomycetaceae bacterium]|nr:carbon storage regulator [Planctomycetaceae bacterium]
MLVLSRKLNEQIRIDEQITVTVLRVKGNTVRLGIEAPKEVRVRRGELPRLEKRSQAPLASRTNKLPRLAEIDPDPKPRVDQDQRQQAGGSVSHTDRWTVANMRNRTQSDQKSRVRPTRGRENPVLG